MVVDLNPHTIESAPDHIEISYPELASRIGYRDPDVVTVSEDALGDWLGWPGVSLG